MSRQEFYENAVNSMSFDDFCLMFGCAPADVQDFDYDFGKVHWNMSLEYAYNYYLSDEEESE